MSEKFVPPEYITVVKDYGLSETPPSTEEHRVESYQKLGAGMEGVVYRVQIKNQEGKIEPYALKILTEPVYSPELKDNYELAKQAGLPVPERFDVSNRGILMTDLSDNGRNLVLSINDLKASHLEDLRHEYPELMKTFSQQDIQSLKKEMWELAKKASEAHLLIDHEDAWFFVMEPNGKMRLVLSDFLHLKKTDRSSFSENESALSVLIPHAYRCSD